MPGFDKSKIIGVSEEDLDEFTCNICFEIFVNPVVAQCCRQIYCKECITEWLTHDSSCPNDRQPLCSDELGSVPRIVSNLLSKMKVKCDFESNGCKSVVQMHELADHSKGCEFNICQNCGFSLIDKQIHNCIENLKIKNESISDEIERLRTENAKLNREIINLMEQVNNQKPKMTDFSGKFKLISSEHYNEFLEEIGVNYMHRSIASISTLELSKNGDKYTMKILTAFKITLISFELEKEFEEFRLDGKKVTSIVFAIGNKLVQYQWGDKLVKIVREFNGDELKVTQTVGSVTSVELYVRQ